MTEHQQPQHTLAQHTRLSEEELKQRWVKKSLLPADDFDTHVEIPIVNENIFRTLAPEDSPLPSFESSKGSLPSPLWDGHSDVIGCYWKAWEIAYSNLRKPTKENGFVSNYIDTAFNDCLFMWDSSFIVMFGRYAGGAQGRLFHNTLNNLYARQHPDGFICREIREKDGKDMWHRFDVCSTGPNILGWAEWAYYLNTGDKERLAAVFPVLLAFHRWFRNYRSWQDGTYFSSGGGSGMDNQPRALATVSHKHTFYHHGHMSWIDTSFQQLLSCDLLCAMAAHLNRMSDVLDIQTEAKRLSRTIHSSMWDDQQGFYVDKAPDGTLSNVMTVGAYWGLLTSSMPADRVDRFVKHLDDPKEFNRPHRVPSLAASHGTYSAQGGYWLGAVWAPTTYMVLQGLLNVSQVALAHDIAVNHVTNVAAVFASTGTLWENYSPESASPGKPSKGDFVGWTGLAPITCLFEFVFGIRPNVPNNELVWDVRLTEAHGIDRYPFGTSGVLSLQCAGRSDTSATPVIRVTSNVSVRLRVTWSQSRDVTIAIAAGYNNHLVDLGFK